MNQRGRKESTEIGRGFVYGDFSLPSLRFQTKSTTGQAELSRRHSRRRGQRNERRPTESTETGQICGSGDFCPSLRFVKVPRRSSRPLPEAQPPERSTNQEGGSTKHREGEKMWFRGYTVGEGFGWDRVKSVETEKRVAYIWCS